VALAKFGSALYTGRRWAALSFTTR
jgi:hypothetical protein